MKKALILMITILTSICLWACEAPHQHSFSKDWSSNAQYHWHEPLCNDVSPEMEKHTFVQGKCSVCDYK